MKYISIFIGWFLEHFTSADISMVQVFVTLAVACINALYIYIIYRVMRRKTIYSKCYGITISSIAVIVTAIILAVHSSVMLSLGVIGALSIVRFRTAFKDALDIVFLFWAVTVGLCYGAHVGRIAVFLSAFLTLLIFYLDSGSVKRGYRLLITESENVEFEKVWEVLETYSKGHKVKVRKSEGSVQKNVVELKTKQEYEIIREIKKISGVCSISIIEQEGEHGF